MADTENTAKTTYQSPAGTNQPSNRSSASLGDQPMDQQLQEASNKGDANPCKHLILKSPDIMFNVTPQGNNCLHIAAMLCPEKLTEEVLSASQVINLDNSLNKIISVNMAEKENTAQPNDYLPAEPPSAYNDDPHMNRRLLKACNTDDLNLFEYLIVLCPDLMLCVTPDGNNCLHIAVMLGHGEFAKEVWSRSPSLLSSTNKDGETPFIIALMAANVELASNVLTAAKQHLQPDLEGGRNLLNEMLLKTDKHGDNALHHAIRNGLVDLALELLEIESGLSKQVDNIGVSPMHMAARRGYSEVVKKLLKIPYSAYSGPANYTALHAAVESGDHDNDKEFIDIIHQLLKARPKLAYHIAQDGHVPITIAVANNNVKIVQMLLEDDPNQAYIKHEHTGDTPFITAARTGFVSVAEVIFRICPGSAYPTNYSGANALHIAIYMDRREFVVFILRTTKLHRLINQVDNRGNLPLHHAAIACNPEILRSLLNYKEQDYTALNVENNNAVDLVCGQDILLKTLRWNESFTLLSNVIPSAWRNTAADRATKKIKQQAIEEVKSLTKRYTANTSLVAALLATITFAAAFTLPGGVSTEPSNAGLPIFARKAAFQVFLISDTIAMCSSLAVAFLCVLATWEDMDFLLNYRKTTRALMWGAYAATAVAFGTGLFTVMAPKRLWLAILILVLCCIVPFLSKIMGDWPLIKLRLRLGRHFRSDLVSKI